MFDEMNMDDEIEPVVIDAGSSWFRAGIAGNDIPTCVIPSSIGCSRFSKDKADGFVGDQLQTKKDLLSLRYPIQRGTVTSWDDMELIISHCYQELKVKPNEQPLVYSVPPLNPRCEQERLAQMMFETFEIPAIATDMSSTFCLYCCGRGSGVMVNIGDGVSFAVPYYESHCLRSSIHRQEFAGRDVTNYLQKSLLGNGYSFTTASEFESVRGMKEDCSYTALDFDAELIKSSKSENSSFSLSDGSELKLKEERFQSMEILFQPSKFGFGGMLSIQEMICKTIESCDTDNKPDIFRNIILSGGTAKNSGFSERVKKEVKQLVPQSMKVNVLCYPEAAESVWIGGSIYGSLYSLGPYFISKQRYEEYGPSVMNMSLKEGLGTTG